MIAIRTPEDLQAVMKTAYAPSAQQWAAISAPLTPAVVIAGAGSGKTTLMAARVVYLVVTGQVRPDEVLGLTFTTKAASALRATYPSSGWCRLPSNSVMTTTGSTTSCSANLRSAPGSASSTLVSST